MPSIKPNVEAVLKEIISLTIAKAYPCLSPVEPLITKGKVAEYQCNNAMGLAKALSMQKPPIKLSPQSIGEELQKSLVPNDVISVFEPTPQGFINLTVAPSYICNALQSVLENGVEAPSIEKKIKVLVDFSSPNIAKEMHVGHLRSTIIGDVTSRLLEFCGHDVERINHVGDWGTAFGMLILYLKRNYGDISSSPPDISDLTAFYRAAKECFDADPVFKDEARREVVKLQAYEEESINIWKYICKVSRDEFNKIYERLNVKGLKERGESFYNDIIPIVLNKLKEANKLEESDGAKVLVSKEWKKLGELTSKDIPLLLSHYLCKKTKTGVLFHPKLLEAMRKGSILTGSLGDEVINLKTQTKPLAAFDCQTDMDKLVSSLGPLVGFSKKGGCSFDPFLLEAFRDAGAMKDDTIYVPLFKFPLMVVKSDGGFTYDTTDLAGVYHRFALEKKDRVIYCTDSGQYEHFRLIIQAAEDMGWKAPPASWDHMGFGLVTGADGKKIKTRSGETAKLKDLMDEARDRALVVLQERETGDRAQGHTPEEMKDLAELLGIAAVKYYDLKQNRLSDYVFNCDSMLDTAGNTATFILYQYARMNSIRRKAGVPEEEIRAAPITLSTPSEKKLGLCLLRFQSVIAKTSEDLLLNHLTDFVYEVVGCFSEFFTNCKVIGDPLQNSRLRMIECVQLTVKKAMDILNIPVVEKM